MALFPNSNNEKVQGNRTLEDSYWDQLYLTPTENNQKKIPPPDPLTQRDGVYVQPEVRTETDELGDVFGWSLSDDQQDSDEDDMDDNVFEMDVDDTEFPPPLKSDSTNPILCQRHLTQPKFSDLESTPYVPPPSYHPGFPYRNQQPNHYAYSPEDLPPVKYIDPSSLQLRRNSSVHNDRYFDGIDSLSNLDLNGLDSIVPPMDPSMDQSMDPSMGPPMDQLQMDHLPLDMDHMPSSTVPLDHMQIPKPGLTDHDLSMDMDMNMNDEVYPLINDSDSAYRRPHVSPALASPEEQGPPELRESHSSDEAPGDSNYEPVEIVQREKPLPRKKINRKRTKSSSGSSASHICTMTFQNGTECKRSFTRPYDLARHQETIHAPVRKTYKCDECGSESKTFSRHDALSRHMRLKHSG